MKIRLLTLGLTAALLAGPAWSDDMSGSGRMSLSNETWGSIYYTPGELKDYQYTRNVESGTRTMTSPLGKVEISDNGLGQYQLIYPKGKVVVDSTSTRTVVDFFGKKYEFTHAPNSFAIKTPSDDIHYKFDSHVITVTGKLGTLKVTEKQGDYRVESPQGLYTYTPTGDGGFTVKGGPLAKHPYFYRGVLLHDAGVGVFIDFKKLDPDNPIFKLVDWTPMMEVHQ